MKELTATSFGWVIAYVLPGLLGLYTISFWSDTVKEQLSAFSKAESTVGLFLVMLLTALLIGLELAAVRWLLFERFICRKKKQQLPDFSTLAIQGKMAAFRIVVDEHYKYHQFWGGLTPVIPAFFFGLAKSQNIVLCSKEALTLTFVMLLFEAITVAAAVDAYNKYVDRARSILKEANSG